jgi:hypothetical protein
MRSSYLLSLLIASCFFFGCKKNLGIEKFDIRFEIITTTSVSSTVSVITKVGLAYPIIYSEFTTGTSWSKTVIAETGYRPITINMNAQNIFLTGPGSATCNIYVNGVVKNSSTASSIKVGAADQVTTTPIQFNIQ